MTKERNVTIDVMRGITIILVVVGHLIKYESYPFKLIFSFHMPIFFLLSGYCSTLKMLEADKLSFGKYVWKKIKSIYIPMLIASFLVNLVLGTTENVTSAPLKFIYSPGDWFLQTLFWSDMLLFAFIALCRRFDRSSVRIILPVAFIAIATQILTLSRVEWAPVNKYLPFHIGYVSVSFAFVLIGYLIAVSRGRLSELQYLKDSGNCDNVQADKKKKYDFILAVLLVLMGIVFLAYTKNNIVVNIATTYIGSNYIMFFAMALYMIYLVYVLSKKIAVLPHVQKLLAFLGRNSLFVYLMHSLVHYSMNRIIEYRTGILYTPMIDLPRTYALLYFVLDFAIIIPYVLIYKKIKSVLQNRLKKLLSSRKNKKLA